ncbi:DNA-binding transcriptional LysR family regulator [Saccharopolyspora erythraea NRRL 2338]|uniref:LysR-family transcriptional regulator n=2 Tax=Saccharopolyspora erythraea TaxID=1836 RepID=A4FGH9_SACEN|nr:LysR family transcriptional regulator [Saccharopolyspora erythraea]EQD83845.1 LysR family transcriptional regulator [Saccharopolyspora erythraea D]PFG96859.1 DNA-binding transcriptional LysR family regulator [Saccharopolyspora erythraea NRRL 2338]QRK87096.1 LysR family transcriptional regulator [Saccharopolyspora erythraea]CAM03154.1 LysR-family transcriptional regulator [Saccharopolyspora erythraea NRRL 2338]
MLNPIHLRTLQECVRTGSFAEAGRVLGYTASAVSQQMVLLERAIGASLFERSARSARSTGLAIRLAERSRDALGALDALEREVHAMVVGDEGSLRLASFATANARVLPDVLAAVVAQRPNAEVQLDEGEPDEVLDGVLDGVVDAAVVFEYDLDPRQWPVELCVTELMAEPLRLALPDSHPLAGSPEVDLRELSDEAWICTRQDTAGARSLVRLAAAAGFVPRIIFRSNDYAVIRDLVARGLGVAVLPAMALGDDHVRFSRIAGWQPHRRVRTLHRKQNTNPLLPIALEYLARSCAALAESWHAGERRQPIRAEAP